MTEKKESYYLSAPDSGFSYLIKGAPIGKSKYEIDAGYISVIEPADFKDKWDTLFINTYRFV